MNGDQKRCMGCMSPLAEGESCSCGYAPTVPADLRCLAPETLLGERYLLGKVESRNGEGFLYTAFDKKSEQKVWIKEFFPVTLAKREGSAVLPKEGRELSFKSHLSDFSDLLKDMGKFSENEHIVPTVDILWENGTVYAVYPDRAAKPLESYLSSQGMSWNESKRILLQLANTVSCVHRQGMIHGGLSPKTVLLDEDGVVYLTAFATADLRADRTDLEEELFAGYSAPEQYSLSSWQGPWTDVYALAAILYRMVMGVDSPDAITRRVSDKLNCLQDLQNVLSIPAAAAVTTAMRLSPEERYQSVEEFTAALLRGPGGGTAVFDTGHLPGERGEDGGTVAFDPQHPPEAPTPPAAPPRRGLPYKMMGIGALCALVLAGVVGAVAFPQKMPWYREPTQAVTPAPEGNVVPNLLGMHINALVGNSDITGKFELYQREEFNEDYPAGVVVYQSPPAGVKMLNKGTVILTVSKGSVKVKMPDLTGSKLEFALQLLTTMDIPYQVQESDDYEPGIVWRTSIPYDQWVNKVNDKVTIYVGTSAENSRVEESLQEGSSSAPSASSGESVYTRPAPLPESSSQSPMPPESES